MPYPIFCNASRCSGACVHARLAMQVGSPNQVQKTHLEPAKLIICTLVSELPWEGPIPQPCTSPVQVTGSAWVTKLCVPRWED